MRRAVRSAPLSAATALTSGEGSTANVRAARKRLKAKQASRIFAEDLGLLALVDVLARADRRDGVRILRVEVRVVARHQDVVLAELSDRARELALVRFAGGVAVAPDVFGGRHLHVARDLREVLGPFPVVVHAVHPVEDPLGAAFEEDDFQPGKFLEHAAEY